MKSFGDQFFRGAGTVRIGRVDEVDAEFNRAAQRGQRAGLIDRRPQMPLPVMRMAPKPMRLR